MGQHTAVCDDRLLPDLGDVDLSLYQQIYLLGPFSDASYAAIEKWLSSHSENRAVQVCAGAEDLRDILFCASTQKLFSHERIALEFFTMSPQMQAMELLRSHAGGALKIFSGAQRFDPLFDALYQKSLLLETREQEIFCYPKILSHVVQNFSETSELFLFSRLKGAFSNTPALICGGGPSCHEITSRPKGLLTIAAGSGIAAMPPAAGMPHFALCIDPNREEYERLKAAPPHQIPVLFGGRVLPEALGLFNGPKGYLSTLGGGEVEAWIESQLDSYQESIFPFIDVKAMSSTYIAILCALFLGCPSIYLIGVDLSHVGGEEYAGAFLHRGITISEGVKHKASLSKSSVPLRQVSGKNQTTELRWKLEKEALERLAAHFTDRAFYNLSPHGLEIRGFQKESFSTCETNRGLDDIDELVAACVQSTITPKRVSFRPIVEAVERMSKQLESLVDLSRQQMDSVAMRQMLALEDDPYYPLLLQTIDRYLCREKKVPPSKRYLHLRDYLLTVKAELQTQVTS